MFEFRAQGGRLQLARRCVLSPYLLLMCCVPLGKVLTLSGLSSHLRAYETEG